MPWNAPSPRHHLGRHPPRRAASLTAQSLLFPGVEDGADAARVKRTTSSPATVLMPRWRLTTRTPVAPSTIASMTGRAVPMRGAHLLEQVAALLRGSTLPSCCSAAVSTPASERRACHLPGERGCPSARGPCTPARTASRPRRWRPRSPPCVRMETSAVPHPSADGRHGDGIGHRPGEPGGPWDPPGTHLRKPRLDNPAYRLGFSSRSPGRGRSLSISRICSLPSRRRVSTLRRGISRRSPGAATTAEMLSSRRRCSIG